MSVCEILNNKQSKQKAICNFTMITDFVTREVIMKINQINFFAKRFPKNLVVFDQIPKIIADKVQFETGSSSYPPGSANISKSERLALQILRIL